MLAKIKSCHGTAGYKNRAAFAKSELLLMWPSILDASGSLGSTPTHRPLIFGTFRKGFLPSVRRCLIAGRAKKQVAGPADKQRPIGIYCGISVDEVL